MRSVEPSQIIGLRIHPTRRVDRHRRNGSLSPDEGCRGQRRQRLRAEDTHRKGGHQRPHGPIVNAHTTDRKRLSALH